MSSQTRDRSPSQAAHAQQYISTHGSAPSHHAFVDPSLANTSIAPNQFDSLSAQTGFDTLGDLNSLQGDQNNFYLNSNFGDLQQAPALPSQTSNDVAAHTFLQSSALSGQGLTNFSFSNGAGSNHVPSLNHSSSLAGANDSSAFPTYDFNQDFDTNSALDPSILDDLTAPDLNLQTNPNSLNNMAAMQSHSPTPPHLLPDMSQRHSRSQSPATSPQYPDAAFGMQRQRGASESLDPSSALFPHGPHEWSNMGAYRGHRRTPSDNYSEYSSHSNQASPYINSMDTFDANAHSSPLLNSTDPVFSDGLGLQQFSLNENNSSQVQQTQSFHTPGQSPHISPRLMPTQQPLPQFMAENEFGMSPNMNGQFVSQQNGVEMFPGSGQEPFPMLNNNPSPTEGNANAMSPPEINIHYAAPTAPMNNVQPGNNEEALSPPMRTQSRNRMRAKSDSYAGSRSPSPAVPSRGRSPSLQPQLSTGSDTLSPFDNPPSRSPSPARGRNGSLGRARSGSNTSDRDTILKLAEPDRSPSNGPQAGRVQKHPATFQCTLCPKRFTRAYNLRSHLRTHTDERPFVCTVCGKAFARQHDRKRHEGLHSGEKKFVCRGTLQGGGNWGCGRRFARADALGRHFRSEAGRVCIKPLLEEEAAERQKAWMEEQQQAQVAAGLVAPAPLLSQPQVDMMAGFLPAAILQQYPALAALDWNSMPAGPPPNEDDYSGRSSFDASSGGEYDYGDLSEGEIAGYDMSGMGMQGAMGMPQAHAGAVGQRAYYGGQTGEYLNDFEGR